MLRIAVQSKGRLYDETMMLLEEAGIKLNRGKRILLLSAKGFPVEVLFLRDDDIPQSVANWYCRRERVRGERARGEIDQASGL